MVNWDKLKTNNIQKKIIIPVTIVLAVCLIIAYFIIILNFIRAKMFEKQIAEIVQKNNETVFSIEKLYVCSSANAIDVSQNNSLRTLSLYQYSDLAIYINNYKDKYGISNKNTIKNLYIDNINITTNSNIGEQNLSYTNLLKIGDKHVQPDFTKHDRIDFNIINNNDQNSKVDYSNPTFYADCSNPISLKYVNNLGKDYTLQQDNSVSFDGSILQKAGVSIQDINCKLKFKINIVNNEGNYFSCWVNTNLPLNEIYSGVSIKSMTPSGIKYNFFEA